VIGDSPVAGEYDELEDRESAYEILKKRTEDRVGTQAADEQGAGAGKTKASGGSRSDSFWTTLGKQVIRTVVPAATRMLEREIRRGVLGGVRRRG
jgi:hypothetical protein